MVARMDDGRQKKGVNKRTIIAIFCFLISTVILVLVLTKDSKDKRQKTQKTGLSKSWQIPNESYHPLSYSIELFVYLPGYGNHFKEGDKFTTRGKVVIDLLVNETVDGIELHVNELEIIKATLSQLQNTSSDHSAQPRPMSMTYNETLYRVGFSDGTPINPGRYFLEIRYSGKINNRLDGLYRSLSEGNNGKKKEKRYIAVTQSQATHARQIVPCFDEPRFKARWHLVIHHPLNTKVNSNVAIRKRKKTLINGHIWETSDFHSTPKMSSYLLALVVHNWTPKRVMARNNRTMISIYARPEAIGSVEMGLDVAFETLDLFEKLLKMPYPMSKLDLFAVPDFEHGAMENWGLIVFSEPILLVDGVQDKQSKVLRRLMAHEIAHQWFGNLVTLRWWNELWLNEGFAHFMELFAYRFWMPEDEAIIEFMFSDKRQAATRRDARLPRRAVVEKVDQGDQYNIWPRTPGEIRAMINPLTYAKGGFGLFSMYKMLGHSNFFAYLKNYLIKHQHGTVNSEDIWSRDLFNSTDMALWENVHTVLRDHLHVPGLPVLMLNRHQNGSYSFTEKLYDSSSIGLEISQFPKIHRTFPISIEIESNRVFTCDKERLNDLLSNISIDSLPILNFDGRGYTRICYGNEWKRVLEAIDETALSPLSRAILYDDLFAMADIGRVPYSLVLDFTISRLGKKLELNRAARSVLSTRLREIFKRVKTEMNPTQRLLCQKVCKQYGRYDQLSQACLFNADGFYRDKIGADELELKYKRLLDEEDLNAVKTLVAFLFTSRIWKYPEMILNGLIEDGRMISLNGLLDETQTQRLVPMLPQLSQHPNVGKDAIKFLIKNGKRIHERLHKSWSAMLDVYSWLLKAVSNEDDIRRINQMRSTLPQEAAEMSIWEETFEEYRLRVKWNEKIKPQIVDWFERYLERETSTPTKNSSRIYPDSFDIKESNYLTVSSFCFH
ncbi:unnamed protein product, partial [Mesorhabditis belari]|uniref:Aminopeptidase n=1 Tax=Mesorhabditis belari TaxID=2138241 RepID=A0AAF3EJG8_9BILA